MLQISDIEMWILDILAPRDEIDWGAHPLGELDSLAVVEFQIVVEELAGVILDYDDFVETESLSALIRRVQTEAARTDER